MRLVALAALLVAGCSYGSSPTDVETQASTCAPVGGPWTQSPEANWVWQVVEAGGYRVVAVTGSALVASGKGHEFYIWATEGRSRPRKGRQLATVRGVPVYGHRDLWRWWHAQGFTFWVQGAAATPAAGRLAPVVDASLRLRFRDECRA
jgi:hypothetical protein